MVVDLASLLKETSFRIRHGRSRAAEVRRNLWGELGRRLSLLLNQGNDLLRTNLDPVLRAY